MEFKRASGILLHPTSLPGDHGIGDLGPEAFRFIDFLVAAKQTYWQILPLGPTGWGDSPYSSFSAFAGNTLLISPEKLVEDGILPDPGPTSQHPANRIDYGAVHDAKREMLRLAFENFDKANDADFEAFTQENVSWLDDYALYRSIKAAQDQRPWLEWDEPLKTRDETALRKAGDDLMDAITAEKFYQFLFFRQWSGVRQYANEKGIKIVGDVPIFAALDSADVWRHQHQFKLNDDGTPKVVSGVPPDYFSKTGQLWGNPIYDWNAMRDDGFSWWIDRVKQTLKTVDVVRVDHFRGFAGAWEVPGGNPTAEHGEWGDAPGRDLFQAFADALGDLPFWVEDLGFITPEVESLRDEFNLPGMRILQFAFGGDPANQALPHNYIRNCVAYTGTHDNDTAVGWWNSQPADSEARRYCMQYLGSDGSEIAWDMIRAISASVADSMIAPLQDVLGLDNDSRMNRPATTDGNWQWRYKKGDLTDEIAARFNELTTVFGR